MLEDDVKLALVLMLDELEVVVTEDDVALVIDDALVSGDVVELDVVVVLEDATVAEDDEDRDDIDDDVVEEDPLETAKYAAAPATTITTRTTTARTVVAIPLVDLDKGVEGRLPMSVFKSFTC